MPATTVLINKGDPKTQDEVAQVANWLKLNTKHFGRMPRRLLDLVSTIMYVAPHSLGGGTYRKGDLIMPSGHRPKNIFILFEGTIKKTKSEGANEKNSIVFKDHKMITRPPGGTEVTLDPQQVNMNFKNISAMKKQSHQLVSAAYDSAIKLPTDLENCIGDNDTK